MRFGSFCLHVTGYLKTKKSFPICKFVVMASGKCELHIYFTFLLEFKPPHIREILTFFSSNIRRKAQHLIFGSRLQNDLPNI